MDNLHRGTAGRYARVMTAAIHYLDNAATTPVDPVVVEAYASCLATLYGNPSSLHPIGIAAGRRLHEDRELLRGMLGAAAIVFTGGGTEATNLAMRGSFRGSSKGAIVVGAADHPSVLNTAKSLAEDGHELRIYPVDRKCHPVVADLERLLDDSVRFVSILHGNNEVGTVPDTASLVPVVRARAPRAHVHLDAVQAVAKLPIDVDRLGVDSVSIAAHKFHGPKGVGALALGPKRQPNVLLTGGGQESGLRSGTENVCGNHALVRAAERWISRQAEETARVAGMRDRIRDSLSEAIDDLEILGDPDSCLPHLLSIAIVGVAGEVVMHHLEEHGICVSTGSACSQRSERRGKTGSHVLRAMGLPDEWIKGTLRISVGRFTTDDDVDAIVTALPEIVIKLRQLGL